jgi:hypothetical protein
MHLFAAFVLLSRRKVSPPSDGTPNYRANKSAEHHARYAKFPEAKATNNYGTKNRATGRPFDCCPSFPK